MKVRGRPSHEQMAADLEEQIRLISLAEHAISAGLRGQRSVCEVGPRSQGEVGPR